MKKEFCDICDNQVGNGIPYHVEDGVYTLCEDCGSIFKNNVRKLLRYIKKGDLLSIAKFMYEKQDKLGN